MGSFQGVVYMDLMRLTCYRSGCQSPNMGADLNYTPLITTHEPQTKGPKDAAVIRTGFRACRFQVEGFDFRV